ncbi:MAG: hypothetical protein AAB372_03860 [Patescibacteria group bacterium]
MNKGVAALIIIFVIGGAAFLMVYRNAFLGLGELENGITYTGEQRMIAMTEGCMEEALLRLRRSATYTGGTLQITGGSCTISVTGAGSNRTITTTARMAGTSPYCRQIESQVTRTGFTITLGTWVEKTNWVTAC